MRTIAILFYFFAVPDIIMPNGNVHRFRLTLQMFTRWQQQVPKCLPERLPVSIFPRIRFNMDPKNNGLDGEQSLSVAH